MYTERNTGQEIATLLWNVGSVIRGRVARAHYRNIVLSILFLKYVDDVYQFTLQENKIKYAGDLQRVERAMQYTRFKVSERSSFTYLYQHRRENGFGEMINVALALLEEENEELFTGAEGRGLFRNIDFTSDKLGDMVTRNELLRDLFRIFSDLDLYPENQPGKVKASEIFVFLSERLTHELGKNTEDLFTPRQVSSLLAKLTKSLPGSRICDPAAGSGGLLIEAAREVDNSNFFLYAQEINYNAWGIAKMNMIFHGLDSAVIELGDTLRNPKLFEGDKLMQFDTVLSHPPFSVSKWGADEARNDIYNRFYREIPPDSKADWAFISHMLAVARADKGRVGVIVPHGVLFRGGSEGRIRRRVIEEMHLEAVIGLPANLFYGTTIPAAIILFDKGKKRGETLFIDASQEYEKGKKQHLLREKDIRHIVDTYTRFKKEGSQPGVLENQYAYIATIDEIEKNDYNLNIPNYVDTLQQEAKTGNLHEEIRELEKKLTQVQTHLADSFKKLNS